MLTAVSGAVSCIEPRFIKTLYSTHDYTSEGNLAHSTTQIYDPTSGDEKRTMKTTAQDAARRRLTYNDPAMAAIFNFVHFIGGEQNATGYFRNEMPLVTEVEPTSMVWKKYFGEVDGRELTWDSSDEDKQVIVNRVLDAYDRYGGIDGMIDNGIVIPYVSRYYVTSYLYACQNANWNSFYERQYSKGGFSSQEERQEAAEDVQQKNAALNEQIKAIQDAKLPYSPYTLHRYETDYWKYYYVEDESGNRTPTNPVFYWFNHDILHDPSYHEEYYASGDHKSSLNPYLMVDTDNVGTFDREKRTPWYDEDGKLDKEKLLADIGDEVIETGQFKLTRTTGFLPLVQELRFTSTSLGRQTTIGLVRKIATCLLETLARTARIKQAKNGSSQTNPQRIPRQQAGDTLPLVDTADPADLAEQLLSTHIRLLASALIDLLLCIARTETTRGTITCVPTSRPRVAAMLTRDRISNGQRA